MGGWWWWWWWCGGGGGGGAREHVSELAERIAEDVARVRAALQQLAQRHVDAASAGRAIVFGGVVVAGGAGRPGDWGGAGQDGAAHLRRLDRPHPLAQRVDLRRGRRRGRLRVGDARLRPRHTFSMPRFKGP